MMPTKGQLFLLVHFKHLRENLNPKTYCEYKEFLLIISTKENKIVGINILGNIFLQWENQIMHDDSSIDNNCQVL